MSWSAGRDMNAVNIPSSATSSANTGDLFGAPIEVGGLNMAPTMSTSLPFLAVAVIAGIYLLKR